MAAAENQVPVETLATDGPDPAFGVGARLRHPHRRLDHPDALGAEDLVEIARELAVAVTDQEARADILVIELHQQVARLLSHPPAIRIRRDAGEADATRPELNEEQDVEALEEERIDSQEVALKDARRLSAQEVGPALLKPPRRRIDPRVPQDRPDRASRELETETDQLALDPPVPPARVLPRKPHDELPNLGTRRGPAGTTVRIRPAARNQIAMQAKQRRWRHKRRPPPRPPRQHSTEGSQQRAVGRRQRRPRDLPLEHSQPVAQQQNLDLLLPLRAEPKHDKLEQPPQRPVEKGEDDPARARHGR